LGQETDEERQARERFEAFRLRIAELRASEGLPPKPDRPQEDLSGLTVAEVLQRGRARLHANAGDNEHA
jgi:hypothetical protein